MAKKIEKKFVNVTLVKSPIGFPEPQKRTAKALGLRRMNITVEHEDTPVLRGMLKKIIHLVRIEE
jgi:large subunit ribosomal protein L30